MNARNRFPLRGGNWNNGSNAGLGALNLNNGRSNANSNIGFRPALEYARSNIPKGGCQCDFEKDAASSAIAEKEIKPVDASIGCTYEKIYQFENILNSAYQCRKGKTVITKIIIQTDGCGTRFDQWKDYKIILRTY